MRQSWTHLAHDPDDGSCLETLSAHVASKTAHLVYPPYTPLAVPSQSVSHSTRELLSLPCASRSSSTADPDDRFAPQSFFPSEL